MNNEANLNADQAAQQAINTGAEDTTETHNADTGTTDTNTMNNDSTEGTTVNDASTDSLEIDATGGKLKLTGYKAWLALLGGFAGLLATIYCVTFALELIASTTIGSAAIFAVGLYFLFDLIFGNPITLVKKAYANVKSWFAARAEAKAAKKAQQTQNAEDALKDVGLADLAAA